jgi:hypothetical protein
MAIEVRSYKNRPVYWNEQLGAYEWQDDRLNWQRSPTHPDGMPEYTGGGGTGDGADAKFWVTTDHPDGRRTQTNTITGEERVVWGPTATPSPGSQPTNSTTIITDGMGRKWLVVIGPNGERISETLLENIPGETPDTDPAKDFTTGQEFWTDPNTGDVWAVHRDNAGILHKDSLVSPGKDAAGQPLDTQIVTLGTGEVVLLNTQTGDVIKSLSPPKTGPGSMGTPRAPVAAGPDPRVTAAQIALLEAQTGNASRGFDIQQGQLDEQIRMNQAREAAEARQAQMDAAKAYADSLQSTSPGAFRAFLKASGMPSGTEFDAFDTIHNALADNRTALSPELLQSSANYLDLARGGSGLPTGGGSGGGGTGGGGANTGGGATGTGGSSGLPGGNDGPFVPPTPEEIEAAPHKRFNSTAPADLEQMRRAAAISRPDLVLLNAMNKNTPEAIEGMNQAERLAYAQGKTINGIVPEEPLPAAAPAPVAPAQYNEPVTNPATGVSTTTAKGATGATGDAVWIIGPDGKKQFTTIHPDNPLTPGGKVPAYADGGKTMAPKMVIGDPQVPGRPNPELVTKTGPADAVKKVGLQIQPLQNTAVREVGVNTTPYRMDLANRPAHPMAGWGQQMRGWGDQMRAWRPGTERPAMPARPAPTAFDDWKAQMMQWWQARTPQQGQVQQVPAFAFGTGAWDALTWAERQARDAASDARRAAIVPRTRTGGSGLNTPGRPATGGSGLQNEVLGDRTNIKYAKLNPFDVGFDTNLPTIMENFWKGRESEFAIPVADQIAEWQRFRMPGGFSSQVNIGV